MARSTVGQALIDYALPPQLRRRGTVLDKTGIADLFDELARDHPDLYRGTAKRLSDVGREVAYSTGGFSFGLRDMIESPASVAVRNRIRRQIAMIHARKDLDRAAKDKAVVAVMAANMKTLESTVFDEALAEGNPLARQVLNVGRGNKASLKSLRAGDLAYEDQHGRPIPVAALRPYSAGLSPAQYFAAAFGARKGVIDAKLGTAQAGALAKQLNQVAHRLVVVADDADEDPPDADLRGMPADVDDRDNIGALLARAAGTYARNTVITPRVLADLRTQGVGRILVRSPIVGGPPVGGVYARDVGIRERGGLSPRGDFVGLAAAQALAERISQGSLNSRHGGGVVGAAPVISGFQHLDAMIQVPKTFPGGTTHARVDGRLSSIQDAPQGGVYAWIGEEKHYVPAGQKLSYAVGDEIEAGDALSDGLPNPAEIVRHKGIGEGRAHFVRSFLSAYRGAGMPADRRNVELLARGLIDHVRVDDEIGDYIPDEIAPYSQIEREWQPRPGARTVAAKSAVGRYLEKPILHHSIGTKVRKSMLADLQKFGVKDLLVHDDPPPFAPVMIRGMASLQHDPDFLTRHLGGNLQRSTLEALHRGRHSDASGTSYVPAVVDRTTFGRQGLTTGWSRGDLDGPRDGDADGRVRDGTPDEAPADRPQRDGLLGLLGI